jgi:Tfp pilus assembly protein PilP
MMRLICCTLLALLVPTIGAAQAPSATPASPAPQAAPVPTPAPAATAEKPSPIEPQGYTYNAAGRRDPFVSILRPRNDPSAGVSGARSAGLAGLVASEVSLRGTLESRGGYVAILQGSDNKSYIVRQGDKLRDGTIRAITADTMVILQRVNDPLSLEKEREVRKVLRQTEEAK